MKEYYGWFLSLFLISVVVSLATLPTSDSHGYWLWKSKKDLAAMESAIQMFQLDNGRIPNSTEGLEILVKLTKDANLPDWNRYMGKIPLDMWGHKYEYRVNDPNRAIFMVYSTGPDGIDKQGEGDDVTLSKDKYDCGLYNDCYTSKEYINMTSSFAALITIVLLFAGILYQAGGYIFRKR